MEEAKEVLKAFLDAWKGAKWMEAYLLCQKTWMLKRDPYDVQFELGEEIPLKYRVREIRMLNDVVCEGKVWLHYYGGDRVAHVRLIKEIDAYKPRKEGGWGVNPKSINR